MKKIERDTTKDLFLAAFKLVRENGHYDKADAIMDYVLPNESEDNIREDIELSNYRFDFDASVQFGGSEGIYIDCFLSGEYTETERKIYNVGKGIMEKETRRHIGTFKTLKEDIESMKIMGELCGALIFCAHQYVNKNIARYTPTRELEQEDRRKNADLALKHYIRQLSADIVSGRITVAFDMSEDNVCENLQGGCANEIQNFLKKEIGKLAYIGRYSKESSQYCEWVDGAFNPGADLYGEYVITLMEGFPDLTICQAAGYVYTWLCTRKQDFFHNSSADE